MYVIVCCYKVAYLLYFWEPLFVFFFLLLIRFTTLPEMQTYIYYRLAHVQDLGLPCVNVNQKINVVSQLCSVLSFLEYHGSIPYIFTTNLTSNLLVCIFYSHHHFSCVPSLDDISKSRKTSNLTFQVISFWHKAGNA